MAVIIIKNKKRLASKRDNQGDTMATNQKQDRVPTGIPGFDKLVEGGFVKGSVNLISGGTGTGKTIFGMQYLHNGALKFNEAGLLISFEENINSLKLDAEAMGMDFDELERERKCEIISFKPFNNPSMMSDLTGMIKKLNIKRIVIDSISVYTMSFNNDMFKIRKEIYNLCDLLESLGCTSLLTAEMVGEVSLDIQGSGGALSRDGIVEFVSDSVITVHNSGIGGEGDRAIRILKMRRTNHEKAPTPMRITKKGIEIL